MIDISKGRYWDEGIKLVSGCTRISPGCKNCWSLGMEHRLGQDVIKKGVEGSFEDGTAAGYQIKSERHITVYPDRLKRFNTRKPKVFAIWNDLFHEGVPDSFIEKVYMSMIDFSHNKYLILTKRPKRMAEWVKMNWQNNCIWHGLTVCNQPEADKKIVEFLQVSGRKFLSIEPSLENISLWEHYEKIRLVEYFDLIIMGAETGASARPMDIEWARTIRDECKVTRTPFFLKQLDKKHNRILDGRTHNDLPWVKP